MEGIRVTEIANEIKFKGVWGELEQKMSSETNIHKIVETNSSFHVKLCTTENV